MVSESLERKGLNFSVKTFHTDSAKMLASLSTLPSSQSEIHIECLPLFAP